MKRLIFAILILAGGCAQPDPTERVFVSKFKAGLVCPDLNGEVFTGQTTGIGTGTICEETDTIVVTGNQSCIFNGESRPCTWYGFEFDYENMPDRDLDCRSQSSKAVGMGNPQKVISEDSYSNGFELKVPFGSGRFYNPSYVLYLQNRQHDEAYTINVRCFSGKQKIFQTNFNFVHRKNGN